MALARFQSTIVDSAGNVLAGASVRVQHETPGAPNASIFSDRDGITPLGNPFNADGEGFAAFHVAGGAYRVTATKDGNTRVWRYVALGTIQERDIQANVNGVSEPQLELFTDDGFTQPNITTTAHGLNGGGTFHGRHSRGTRAAPTASQAGDITGGIGSRACYQAGVFHPSSPASIHWQATENQGPANFGMWLRFLTTPKTLTTRFEVGGITDNGTIWSHDRGVYDATSNAQTLPVSDARFVASGDAAAGSAGASFAAVTYGGSGNSSPGFRGMGARGTPAAPSAVQADNFICFVGGHGYGATGFSAGTKALVGFKAAENWTDAAQGTYITLETTPVGSITRVEHLRVTDAGAVYLGADPGRTVLDASLVATNAELYAATAGVKPIVASHLESASGFVVLTDAATIAVDYDTFFNAQVALGANRVLGNPTNGQTGNDRRILVTGADATPRTLTFDTQYFGDLPTLTGITNAVAYLVTIVCIAPTVFSATAHKVI